MYANKWGANAIQYSVCLCFVMCIPRAFNYNRVKKGKKSALESLEKCVDEMLKKKCYVYQNQRC